MSLGSELEMALTAHRDVDLARGERGAEPQDLRLLVARSCKASRNTDACSLARLQLRRGARRLFCVDVHVCPLRVVAALIINCVDPNLRCLLV